RIGPHRRAQRKSAAGLLVVLRTLQHEIAARLVEPVDHLEVFVEVDALDGRYERLKYFQPADRAVLPPLPRRFEPRSPGRADAADKDQPRIIRLGQIDGDFAFADFTLSNHFSIQGYVERLDHTGPAGAIVGDELVDLGLALRAQRRKT